jgi:putative peptide zinc metalloprotease protein
VGPGDPGLWNAVAERVNPAKARPVLRAGIEESNLVSARGVPYAMLRSPDARSACYVRLAPDEVELTRYMDGTRTLARLVAEFARISGRLAPDQVRRVVADLAGNRMLEELPVDAFRPLERIHRRPWPLRFGRTLLAFAQGRRVVLANIDPLMGLLYRAGGRLFFTRVAAALLITVALVGLGAFTYQWWAGAQSVFLTSDSYVAGAAVLLGLNIMALACHEIGHALAAKHAGRRVPSAGFLVYFGIPSAFVDTTDVWMAGRRARLRTTMAGPATGLVLAGTSAIVGLLVPAAAPWCFKLSFAWYLNALFNLNPFLALDGYYLLMDWLEVPNLRARGLAWVAARLRRRPPAWRTLDREGRLVALYGLLATGWLVIALNIGYRVYVDRVAGLITGLWRSGWGARALLVVVVAALASPMVYVLAGWVGKRWRRLRLGIAERSVQRDLPRRVDALRASGLRDLPDATVAALARQARWVHPRTGEQLVFAGGAQSEVYAVVDGALEARAPGDPTGTVRERVGPGGLVGLAPALTGAPAALSWFTAGTNLLAVPSATVASALGPAAASLTNPRGSMVEAEAALRTSPGLKGLSAEDTLGLATVALPISLAPGASISLNGPDDVLVLASGVIATPDGQQLGRGTMVGPSGQDRPPPVAVARTPVRLFSLPAMGGLGLLLRGHGGTPREPDARARTIGQAPAFGVHPPAGYPPLAGPPGPPPTTVDDSRDGWFERRLRWLLVLVLLLALLLTGGNILIGGLAWAEMPSDRALLHADLGPTTAVVNGQTVALAQGDDVYVAETDRITVPDRSLATLTYHGGSTSTLCAGTQVTMGRMVSQGTPVVPEASFALSAGLVITRTTSTSPAFRPLAATVVHSNGVVHNQGPAEFADTPSDVFADLGVVVFNDVPVPVLRVSLNCGNGSNPVVTPTPTSTPSPSVTETPTPTPTPSATPTPTPTPTPNPTPIVVPPPTTSTTQPVPTTTKPTPPPTTTSPPPPPPTIQRVGGGGQSMNQVGTDIVCISQNPTVITITAVITGATAVSASYRIDADGSGGTMNPTVSGITYTFTLGPIQWAQSHGLGGNITVTITAVNAQEAATSAIVNETLASCQFQPPPPR